MTDDRSKQETGGLRFHKRSETYTAGIIFHLKKKLVLLINIELNQIKKTFVLLILARTNKKVKSDSWHFSSFPDLCCFLCYFSTKSDKIPLIYFFF